MKTHLKFLLGLVLMVLVFSGCEDPSRFEVPEGATVEFRWCSCFEKEFTDKGTWELNYPRYLLSLSENEELKSYDYPKGYNPTSWGDLRSNKESFKEFSKSIFEKVFGTKYYEEGTTIDLTKWTSPTKDLVNCSDDNERYTSLSFFEEDVESYDFQKKKSGDFDYIEVRNENIVVYVYWNYYDKNL